LDDGAWRQGFEPQRNKSTLPMTSQLKVSTNNISKDATLDVILK